MLGWRKLYLFFFFCGPSFLVCWLSYISLPFPISPFTPFSALPVLHHSNVQERQPRFGPTIWSYPSPRSEQIILAWREEYSQLRYCDAGHSIRAAGPPKTWIVKGNEIFWGSRGREWTLGISDTICSNSRWEWRLCICPTQWPWEHHILSTTVSSAFRSLSWMMTQESAECSGG